MLVPVEAVAAALDDGFRHLGGTPVTMSSGLRGLRKEPRMPGNNHHRTTCNTRTNFFSIRDGKGRARYVVDF